MRTATLGEVALITMGQAPVGESYNDRGEGLPLIAGAGDFKGERIVPTKFTTLPGKVCAPGDIVLSIRASIGAKVWADGQYCLGRGVAGLRAGSDLDPKYLWHWLTDTEHALAAKGRGATFLQVNRKDIAEMSVPLPTLDEQRRIATILDHADALRVKRRQILSHLDDLTQSVFHDMFGDPIENPHGLPVRALDDLIEDGRPITYGILKPGPHVADGVPYIRVADMKAGGIAVGGVRRTTPAISAQYKRSLLRQGDLLMSIRGHVGRFAHIPRALDGANITQDSARLSIADAATSMYVRHAMSAAGLQRWMARHTKGVAVRGLNIGDLRNVPIPLPAIESQRGFAERVEQVDAQRAAVQKALAADEELFASLQSRAFKGEL